MLWAWPNNIISLIESSVILGDAQDGSAVGAGTVSFFRRP